MTRDRLKVTDQAVVFSTGKVEDTPGCGGLISINSKMEIGAGADQGFPWGHVELTSDERVELADYMIGLWEQYKSVDVKAKLRKQKQLDGLLEIEMLLSIVKDKVKVICKD